MSDVALDTHKKKLFGGVMVLMPATLFTKVIGLFYKIPLIAIVGVEGMAYFLAAYHIYSLLFVLSATGLPTALSLQIARAVAAGKGRATSRIFGVSLAFFLSLGLCGTVALLALAPMLAARLAMADAAASIVAIAPALLLASFIGAAKGFFQGLQQMLPTALCEVLEAAGKLGFGLFFALRARSMGLPTPSVAAYAIFGITAGMALSAAVLSILLMRHAWRTRRHAAAGGELPTRSAAFSELLRVAFPITASASVMSLVALIDTALISARLQGAGFAPAVANAMYSSYGNLAVPLYNLVPSLLSPITLALMPLLGAAHSRGELEGGRGALTSAFRLSALIAIPASLGLGVFARPILSLIYRGQGEAVALAAPLLSLLALSVLPAAMITFAGAALQAIGRTGTPVLAMGVGAAVKLLLEMLLLPVSGIHIYAAPISTLACNLTVLVIEGAALSRALPFQLSVVRDLSRPALAATVSVCVGAAVFLLLSRTVGEATWQMPLSLAVICALFFLLALRWRAVEREDLLSLPAGERICTLLGRLGMIK